jgi:hypothetical protein
MAFSTPLEIVLMLTAPFDCQFAGVGALRGCEVYVEPLRSRVEHALT